MIKKLSATAILAAGLALAPSAGASWHGQRLTMPEARHAAAATLFPDAQRVSVTPCHRLGRHAIRCHVYAQMPSLLATVSYEDGALAGTVATDASAESAMRFTVTARLYRSGRISTYSPFLGWLPSSYLP